MPSARAPQMTIAKEQRATDSPKPPQARTADAPLDAVEALERELAARKRGRFWKLGAVVLTVLAAGLGVQAYRAREVPLPPPPFVTAPVTVRDIVESVESSGKLRPLTEVKVGTQVSGRVVRVHADFNRPVKKGDLLAEIDPSLFGAQVSQMAGQLGGAEAALERASAAEQSAQLIFQRSERLKAESITSAVELEQAENALRIARADVAAANAQIRGLRAQLASASTTLAYTKIYSPIDGIVIDRAVDPGQTVASSFSAPVLFVIAQDLSAMQVLADIDEADVGKVREGMAALVRVDAFPDQDFKGTVTQIRYNPTEVQGVVTYAAVLDVRNEALELRPGMTATVTITTRAAKEVSAVRNAALRFKPREAASSGPALALEPGQRRVYLLDPSGAGAPGSAAPKLAPRLVRVGISDGVWTELAESELGVGAEVVTEERVAPEDKRRKFLGIF